MENKLSGVQGQYFFWEPVNNDIPETELSQHKKLTGPPREQPASRPVASIQSAVLNRLRNMLHRNVFLVAQIRYRPCYLQDTVMRPSTQPLLLHRPFQQTLRIRRQLAVSPNLLRIHLRVRKDLPRSSFG